MGVDQSTITIWVDGSQVSPSISGTPAAYTLSYDPPVDFPYDQNVSVEVDASDLNGNAMATDSYSFTTASDMAAPYIVPYPTINYASDTIDVTYSESNMQNATTEANYTFSPSLNFATPSVDGDDITNPSGNTYRLSMFSVPNNTIFTLTVSNITDQAGNPVIPSSVTINDDDNDDMADDWEAANGIDNPSEDPDSDGLNNLEEYNNNTDPNNSDTDGDTLPDGWEVAYGLDPTDNAGVNGADGDLDNDGWTNYEEYTNGYDPSNGTSPAPTPPVIEESIPRNNSGITNDKRVPTNTSFAVRLNDADGIDITDTTGIGFTIDDGVNPPYTRDLSDSAVFRVVKLTSDPDTQVTSLWAVYDRSLDTYGDFAYDSNVNIKVDAKDRRGDVMAQASFDFNIETLEEHNDAQSNTPSTTTTVDSPSTGLTTTSIDTGYLAGAQVVYDSDEPVTPVFGPTNEVPSLDAVGVDPVYYPLNFESSTVFNTPVRVFIPVPDVADVSDLVIGLYDGETWVVACDADGNVMPAGDGWMVPGSRVNHNNGNPSTIELQVYHFSALQAGSSIGSLLGGEQGATGGGCFVETSVSSLSMGSGRNSGEKALILLLTFAVAAVGHIVTMRRRGGAA